MFTNHLTFKPPPDKIKVFEGSGGGLGEARENFYKNFPSPLPKNKTPKSQKNLIALEVKMLHILAIVLIVVITLCVFLNFVTLPGNWLMAVFVVLWTFLFPSENLNMWFFIIFFGLLVFGEVMEFFLQMSQSKKAGASTTSNILGIIGAIVGAIVCVPFLLGFGAVLGALGGAWLGTFTGELVLSQKGLPHSSQAATAAMWGKFLGMVIKFGIGFYLVIHTASAILE